MPLYSNILSTARKNDSSAGDGAPRNSSSASMKLLQDHLAAKRRSQQQQKSTSSANKQTQDTKSGTQNNQIIFESSLHRLPTDGEWNREDEYDPRVPNSYEVLLADYMVAEQRKMAQMKQESSSGRKSIILPNILDVPDNLDDGDDADKLASDKKSRGSAIAPPPALLINPAPTTRGSDTHLASDSKPNIAITKVEKPESGSVAAKIMSKMGYKAGAGLGKDERGISSPLEVEKSGTNLGRIVKPESNQKSVSFQQDPPTQDTNSTAPTASPNMAELLRESTRVLLLQNMVGPGEVDDELEAETKEECKKYGEVVKCLIYEIPNKQVADEEAVRIFVEFRAAESAIKAAIDLNGRYFGGRIVRASFFSVERFNRYDLGP